MRKTPLLLISNTGAIDDIVSDRIKKLVLICDEVGREVNIFREDLFLLELLKDFSNVKYIKGLASTSDSMLFEREHNVSFTDIVMSDVDYSVMYARAVKRYVAPIRSKMFDAEEYDSRRLGTVYSRLKFVISMIANEFKFIASIKTNNKDNILYAIPNQEFGNGKFMYIVDSNNKDSFYVGGCTQPSDMFEQCLRGVM